MDIRIIAGRRGEAYMEGRVVARIGQWEARTYPGGDWDGACECEWYRGNGEEAFEMLTGMGAEVALKLYDHLDACLAGVALVAPAGELKMVGDVALMELRLKGAGPLK